jgi:hypothetical protein
VDTGAEIAKLFMQPELALEARSEDALAPAERTGKGAALAARRAAIAEAILGAGDLTAGATYECMMYES